MTKKRRRNQRRPVPRRKIIGPRKKYLLLPSELLIRPASLFARRMSRLPFCVPLPGTVEAAHLQMLMDMDIGFRLRMKELQERLPHVAIAREKGGSGLQLSRLLRSYFVEYLTRLFKYGPRSFPTSFNVVESFMAFNREYMFFDLRDEKEHLLSIDDYFRWYDSGEMPREPRVLEDIMTAGTIYSYEMISDASSLRLCGDSQQVFAGVSFVRHEYELSCLLLAGENPPLHSDEDVMRAPLPTTTAPGRDGVVPDPKLTVQDRYLDGYVGFAKVIVLTRFDVRTGRHDVRYVNLDEGRAFTVLTDDTCVFDDLPSEKREDLQRDAIDGLKRYDDLFAALASMIYLPAFFAAHPDRVQELEVSTDLYAMRENEEVRRTIRVLGEAQCVTSRIIHCLPVALGVGDKPQRRIDPPEMQFKSDGYWKAIGPQEIGEDKTGHPIVGRTWVSRHESWSAQSPQSFLLERQKDEPHGPDPGVIYVQRCPAHEASVYKVGLTRRPVETRANELSAATGVPLPFGVLASWAVGDCARVEREVHQRLAAFRINPRREFFVAELSVISRTIDTVIKELSQHPG